MKLNIKSLSIHTLYASILFFNLSVLGMKYLSKEEVSNLPGHTKTCSWEDYEEDNEREMWEKEYTSNKKQKTKKLKNRPKISRFGSRNKVCKSRKQSYNIRKKNYKKPKIFRI